MLYIIDASVLSNNNVDADIQFTDGIVKAFVADVNKKYRTFPFRYNISSTFSLKVTLKIQNEKCRYNFENSFVDHTTVSVPVHDHLPEKQKKHILNDNIYYQKLNTILIIFCILGKDSESTERKF